MSIQLLLTLALAAAPGDWPSFRGDPGLTGVAQGSLPADLALLWTFDAGGAITSSPAVADGRVYFGSDDQKVHCLDARTGEAHWAFETQDMIEAPPLVVDGAVFIGSSDYFFYALDAESGELRWKYETDERVLGGANYFREGDRLRVVVGSYDTKLYCFDAGSGELLWTYTTENYVNGTPAVAGGRVVFGGCDAVLHVVATATGERAAALELGRDSHVAGSVALVDGKAYFGHYGNQVVCVDLGSGKPAWTYDGTQPFFSSPAIGAERVVIGGRDRQLHCLDRATGEKRWTFPTKRKVDGSPVIVGERVVFGSTDGRLHVLALADGSQVWSYDIGKALVSSPAVVGGRIYVGANDGRLYAFGAKEAGGTGTGEGVR